MDESDKRNRSIVNGIVLQFKTLTAAVIDSSSILYLHKTGCFEKLSSTIKLYSVNNVLLEIGFDPGGIELLECKESEQTDTQIVLCAHKYLLPVISEDRRLLRRAEEKSLSFFNTLMMLNLLYFKGAVSLDEYVAFLERLRPVARYSSKVWLFGKMVFNLLPEMEN